MSTPTTPNLGLTKTDRSSPTTTYFNLADIDGNWDRLDEVIGSSDIATQAELDAHAALTSAHGSASAATPGAIMQRDSAGRAKVAAPAAADDIARQDTVDNARKDPTKTFVVEVRTTDPAAPALGQMWVRSDL
jgi:hypothetical protein